MPVVSINSRNADGSPVLKEGEQVLASQPQVTLYFHPQSSEGSGVVYVTTMNVIWLSNDNSNKGYAIDFPYITMHAVSRDTTYFPHQCLYCQLDVEVPEEEEDDEEEDEESMNDSHANGNGNANGSSAFSEARFVPTDPSVCASLNPDEEKEDEGDFFYDEDEVNRNLAALENAEINLPTPDELHDQVDQYDDAEDNDEEMSG